MSDPRSRLVLVLVVSALAVALSLTGCTSPVVSSAPTPAPTESSVPDELERPEIRVGAACDQLRPPTLPSWFSAPIDVVVDQSTPLTSLSDAAMRATGTLYCSWGVKGAQPYPSEYVTIEAIPDGRDAYDGDIGETVPSAYNVVDTLGDDSAYSCGSYELDWGCSGNVLVGSIWARASIQGRSTSALAEDEAQARMRSILLTAVSVLRNSQPTGGAFVAPMSAYPGDVLCANDERVIPVVSEAFVLQDAFHYGYDTFFAQQPYVGLSGSDECGYASETSDTGAISISTLPGGAWWAEGWDAAPPKLSGAAMNKIILPGADDAYVSCVDTSCTAVVSARGSAFEFYASGLTEERLMAGLQFLPQLLDAGQPS